MNNDDFRLAKTFVLVVTIAVSSFYIAVLLDGVKFPKVEAPRVATYPVVDCSRMTQAEMIHTSGSMYNGGSTLWINCNKKTITKIEEIMRNGRTKTN